MVNFINYTRIINKIPHRSAFSISTSTKHQNINYGNLAYQKHELNIPFRRYNTLKRKQAYGTSFSLPYQYCSFSSSSANRNVQIKADPQICLHDVHSSISASGLKPNSPVTFRAETLTEHKKKVSEKFLLYYVTFL